MSQQAEPIENPPSSSAAAHPSAFRHQIFAAQAAATPNAIAIDFEGRQTTYRELDERSNRLANFLRRRGAGRDVPVGICLRRSPDLVAGLLAIMKAGAAFVPLEPSLPPAQLAALLAEARPSVLITESGLLDQFPPAGRTVLCLDQEAAALAREAPTAPAIEVTGDNLVMIMFSSGSTGRPKTILRTYDSFRFGTWSRSTFQLGASDRHLLKTTLDSTLLLLEVFWPLLTGGRMIIVDTEEKSDTAALLGLLVDHQITFLALLPSLLRPLVEEAGLGACTALRHVVCFGEPLPPDVEDRFCQRLSSSLGIIYGTTEAPTLAFRQCRGEGPRPLGNLGYPIRAGKIFILDERLQPVPIAVPGELFAGGPTLSVGYLGDQEQTAHRFIAHPFCKDSGDRLFRTGDRARWRSDGSVEILGRFDRQVKIGGYRIEPAEIEAVLAQHPCVREAAVVARPGHDGDDQLVAYLATRSRGLTAGDLRKHLLSALPAHLIPSVFVELDRLPRRPNGKLEQQALPSPAFNRLGSGKVFAEPRTPMEAKLAPVWADVLGRERTSIHDSFFDLGGTSLKATRLLTAIEDVCGRRLSLATLYLHPTIACLSDLLEAGDTSDAPGAIVEVRRGGSKTPLYFTATMHGGAFISDSILELLPPDQPIYAFAYEEQPKRSRRGSTLEARALAYCDELVAFQPHGAVCLAGYSFGGLLAYEMARLLTARGREVKFLAVVDIGPGCKSPAVLGTIMACWLFLRNLPRWTVHVCRHRSASALFHSARKRFEAPFKVLRNLRGRVRRTGPKLSDDSAPTDAAVLLNYIDALRENCRAPYPGRFILFRARVRPLFHSHSPDLGWGSLVSGKLDIIPLKGDHYSILRQPHVQGLASAFRSALHGAME